MLEWPVARVRGGDNGRKRGRQDCRTNPPVAGQNNSKADVSEPADPRQGEIAGGGVLAKGGEGRSGSRLQWRGMRASLTRFAVPARRRSWGRASEGEVGRDWVVHCKH